MKIVEGTKTIKLKKLFSLHKSEDGLYFATRRSRPAFCFSGQTVEAVSARAYAALKYYEDNLK